MHRSPIFSTDLRWIFCSKEKTLYFCTDRVHHASCLAQRTRVELLFYTGMKYSKQPLTIEQQTSLLKDRGLSIGDEAAARKILDTISYFRLANCLDKQYCRSRQQTIHTAMLHSLPVEQYPSRKYIHPENTFTQTLKELIAAYPNVDVIAMWFPPDWETESLWQ